MKLASLDSAVVDDEKLRLGKALLTARGMVLDRAPKLNALKHFTHVYAPSICPSSVTQAGQYTENGRLEVENDALESKASCQELSAKPQSSSTSFASTAASYFYRIT